MDENTMKRSVELQQRIQMRLEELGFADPVAIARISRLLSEIAVLGQEFAEHSLPLFLTINRENRSSLGVLSASFKADLEQIGDVVSDVRQDLFELVDYLQE